MGDNFFNPTELDLDTGTRLVWSHDGNNPHTVTTASSPGESFDSGVMAAGEQFVTDLDEPGTYNFFCEIHPNQMTATITITEG